MENIQDSKIERAPLWGMFTICAVLFHHVVFYLNPNFTIWNFSHGLFLVLSLSGFIFHLRGYVVIGREFNIQPLIYGVYVLAIVAAVFVAAIILALISLESGVHIIDAFIGFTVGLFYLFSVFFARGIFLLYKQIGIAAFLGASILLFPLGVWTGWIMFLALAPSITFFFLFFRKY